MKPSSAKAKGARCSKEAKAMLHKFAPELQDADIWTTPSGVPGVDVNFSPLARERYPFQIECKNVEKIAIWESIKQCEGRRKPGQFPLLIFKRNNTDLYACIKLEEFLRMMGYGKD